MACGGYNACCLLFPKPIRAGIGSMGLTVSTAFIGFSSKLFFASDATSCNVPTIKTKQQS